MSVTARLAEQLKTLPDKPGVYIFKDSSGKPIYVGKAQSLRKRVASYFQVGRPRSPKTELLIKKIADLEFYVAASEIEALGLESNLIKKYRPRYNVTLRDDKSYPYIAVTYADNYPRVIFTRNFRQPGSKYYGPYTKVYALKETLNTLRKIFPIRLCKGKEPGKKSGSPCLNYHIKRCPAPCVNKISKEEYRRTIDQLVDFLEGKGDQVLARLEKEMKQAAGEYHFERAAKLRDDMGAAKTVLEKQKALSMSTADQDVVGIYRSEKEAYVDVLFIRNGKLIGSRGFIVKLDSEENILSSFIKQFYSQAEHLPKELIVPAEIEEKAIIGEWLEQKKGNKVKIAVPRRGDKKKLLGMADVNASHAYYLQQARGKIDEEQKLEALDDLRQKLQLPKLPERIECFDISNIQGQESVGSMVVFEGGLPKKSDYRKFRIKKVAGQNDFLMMKEVISRRLARLEDKESLERFGRKPDLIVVDGGQPQLTAALESLTESGISDTPVVALAKREEELYLPGQPEPVDLPRISLSLHIVQALRDEAHRFAIKYHRDLRSKKMLSSALDGIPGIGTRRKKKLLEAFRSLDELSKASIEEIKKFTNFPFWLAEKVYNYLHKTGND